MSAISTPPDFRLLTASMPREPTSPPPSRESILLRLLRTPWRIPVLVLLVVFAVEVLVMLLMPVLLPKGLSGTTEALVDSALLTAICAPILWWIIIGPLRRIAMEAQALSNTIVENAGDGILTVDTNGRILSCNPAAQELFGHHVQEMLGAPVTALLPGVELTSTSIGETVSTSGQRGGAVTFPASVSIRRLGHEDQSAVVLVVRDLTEALRAEEERTAAVREQESLKTQQMATLAQLATGVAHEIRNPLTAIKMLVQSTTSQDEMSTLPTEDLRIVEDQIRRMEKSVNALLEFARPGPAERHAIRLNDIVPDVIRLLEGQARNQSVELQVDDELRDTTLSADRDQLQQLLLNLGLNALNVMPGGGTVTFSVRRHHQDAICVLVSDTGPGIPTEILGDIFKPFFTTRKQGIGLGLNICQRIAEEHGGTLTARNDEGGGATFELCLPADTRNVNQEDR
ncbi:MAG: ATP-binding protein [Planctomycetaceae bacterium]